MSLEDGEHDVGELNATVGAFKTDDGMPAAVAIVRFAAFAYLHGGLDFKARGSPRANQVGVALMVVVFVRRALIHRVTEQIRDQSAEVIALDQVLQRPADRRKRALVDLMQNGLSAIHRLL